MLVWIPGKDRGYPAWWEGVQVLAWESDATPVLEPAEAVVALEVPA
jgi:hypothetical protein